MSAERTQNPRAFRDTNVPILRTFDVRPGNDVFYDRGVVGPEREPYELRIEHFKDAIVVKR